jgi:hypothetical protein
MAPHPLGEIALFDLAGGVVEFNGMTVNPSTMGGSEIAPEVTGPGLALSKCEAYDPPYDRHLGSR